MRRYGPIALGIVVLAWGVLAIALDSPTLKLGSSSSAPAPACLPASIDHSAALPGTTADVSPEPGTTTANPHAQISFLGVPAAQIRSVTVVGARSGSHGGHLRPYSQGDGASFVPDAPFQQGERVNVRATLRSPARPATFSFTVDTPFPTAHVPEFPAPPASPADEQFLYTLPNLHPPILSVSTPDRDPAAGDVLTTNGPGPGQFGPLIYTPQGRLVWFEDLPGEETAEDLSVQSYEGRRVLTWWRGRVLSLGFGQGEDVIMDDRYQTLAHVRGGNGLKADLHDFQVAPHAVAYLTAFNPIRCDLTSIGGSHDGVITDNAVQEIDVKTGLVRWEWHTLDHVATAESEVETPKTSEPWDWFHINSIDPQRSGDLFVSGRSTWAGYMLGAGSGRILWRLGGNRSSFHMGPGTKTAWQHDGRILSGNEVSFFDDGANPPIHSQSRAIRIGLDFKTHQARLVSSYTHRDPPLLAPSQGNAQTLSNGNVVVGWGGVPAISEYARDGSLLFDAHLPYDMIFYRAYRFPWSARPLTPPAVFAALNNTGEETVVHASWNGATDVAAWRVLAGKAPSALSPHAMLPASEFEVSTTLPVKYSYVAVQALDAAGHVLGTSRAVAPIGYYASLSR